MVLEAHYMKGPQLIFPNVNLPQNIPLVQFPQNFSIKDQHLLKPPPVLGAVGGFGRRASDGGTHIHTYSQRAVSEPGSQEQLQLLEPGSPALAQRSQPLTTVSPDSPAELSAPTLGEMTADVYRYMDGRGGNKRHTVASGPDDTHRQLSQPRIRKSGLPTVTERPPEISPELKREVEARMMRRHYAHPVAPPLAPSVQRSRLRKHLPLPTLQESCKLPGGRDSLKEVTSLHIAGERFSPVRRASEGSNHLPNDQSFRALQLEHQQILRETVGDDHLAKLQQMRASPSPPSHSGAVSPLTPQGSPIHYPGGSSLTQHMQRLQLQPVEHYTSTSPSPGSIVQGTPGVYQQYCGTNGSTNVPLDLRVNLHQSPSPPLQRIQEEPPVTPHTNWHPGEIMIGPEDGPPVISVTDEQGNVLRDRPQILGDQVLQKTLSGSFEFH